MVTPRLEPLPAEDWDDTVRDAVSPLLPPQRANPGDAGNVLGTLARHPALTRAYLTFNAHLLVSSTLSARVREVALLRAVHVRPCGYLWEHHIPLAQRAGLTLAEIDSIRAGEPTDDVDALVVRAVDEMDGSNTLSDTTWAALRGHFDERQVMDLIFTIGCYQLLGTAVNVFGVEPEEP
ncbi:carboxymuconolactone decarboxylase family protein [Mycobacterium sp. 236(2023)]|uniref:carboxymuconolactone decarboxylase family protein n=1 Tax=Mycobacterium sp. 236(2023) TaxID=3038163 RepID=UPI0024153609|nr:carboxymuconolactone decarboxylase family protein [Mycobacterium sp. 236(2023)]MDG4668500.1 carboxymuconolactone decarboxylase family protein [Mycobacterium sp. 236(2023)]